MTKNINFLNDVYQNAEMGIVGIDDVLYKVKDDKLKREIEREKKEFQKITRKCTKLLSGYKCKPKKINFMTKMSSEFYSEMKLMKENADDIILKMMIEGSYKSVGILTTKLMEYDTIDTEVKAVGEKLLKLINDNISQLKKFDKIC
ncbi:MAG: hypothetical protein E7167_01015 [Firmicutes bacterium]|nr:hypothetical protein [Bacillota bacterium]